MINAEQIGTKLITLCCKNLTNFVLFIDVFTEHYVKYFSVALGNVSTDHFNDLMSHQYPREPCIYRFDLSGKGSIFALWHQWPGVRKKNIREIWSEFSWSWNGVLFQKLFWPTVRKNWFKITFSIWVWSREFSKLLRSIEQFIQTVKGQNKFW